MEGTPAKNAKKTEYLVLASFDGGNLWKQLAALPAHNREQAQKEAADLHGLDPGVVLAAVPASSWAPLIKHAVTTETYEPFTPAKWQAWYAENPYLGPDDEPVEDDLADAVNAEFESVDAA